ncbi:MAG: flagellar hook-basal body complex protein [Buchnera aphidicola (Meitanaphis microgallis)]
MEWSIYTAMTSAKKILEDQEILANNLANISTTGFKSKLRSYTVLSEDMNTEKHYDLYSKKYDLTQGSFHNTMQSLDIAVINQDGWITVQTDNGDIAYTKNGRLNINSKRQLTSQNNIVAGQNGPIVIPYNADIKILSNGTIKIVKDNKTSNQKLEKIKLAKIDAKYLTYGGNGLYFINNDSKYNLQVKDNPNVKILSQTLEDSNVNSSENIINIISDARKFDMQMKILNRLDENIQLINKSLNINN